MEPFSIYKCKVYRLFVFFSRRVKRVIMPELGALKRHVLNVYTLNHKKIILFFIFHLCCLNYMMTQKCDIVQYRREFMLKRCFLRALECKIELS